MRIIYFKEYIPNGHIVLIFAIKNIFQTVKGVKKYEN